MINNPLTKELFENADENCRLFSLKLIPDTKYRIIGVRVPIIKNIAKKYSANKELIENFLAEEHIYYEEWFLHGTFIDSIKNSVKEVFSRLDFFLPHLDSWSVCDSTSAGLKIVKKHKKLFYEKISEYLKSNNPYTVRFAVTLLMNYYLDDDYCESAFQTVNTINIEHYYVNMAIAWFYSTALIKQYDKAVKYLENGTLSDFVHNKSIQKAVESFRISNDIKDYLRKLKRKK